MERVLEERSRGSCVRSIRGCLITACASQRWQHRDSSATAATYAVATARQRRSERDEQVIALFKSGHA